MMTKHKCLIVFLCSLMLLTACASPTPIVIYVTPTQQPAPATEVMVMPTLTFVPATQTPSVVPSSDASVTITDAPPTGIPTILGPLVGPNYTVPPPPASGTPVPITPATAAPELPTSTPGGPTATPGGATPTVLPGLNRDTIGVQIHPLLTLEEWNDMLRRTRDDLGVGWIKVQVSWKLIQPNSPTEFGEDFQRLQLYLQQAKQQGFRILISVAKAPDWARSTNEEDGPPEDPQALADFMSFMLQDPAKFREFVDAIEIWNEPNLAREWRSTQQSISGQAYMRLFSPAYQAIKAAAPHITVISAGLAPTGNNPGSVDDREFLQQMYASGLGQYNDIGIGIHPYGWGNPPDVLCCNTVPDQGWDDDPHFFFANTIADYRTIMASNGDSAHQLWVTEFGWATWDTFPGEPPEPWVGYTSECEQANYTMRALQIGQEREDIGPMFVWNLNFAVLAGAVENRDERAAYGLMTTTRSPQSERPLYWMLYFALLHPGTPSDQCR